MDDFPSNRKIFGMSFGWAIVITLAVLILIGLATALVWGARVGTAEIKGKGDARIQIESVENRIPKQELFETLYQDIQAYDDQINVASQALADFREVNEGKTDNVLGIIAKEDARLAQNLNGLKLICIDTVADYDAEARKISSAKFRDQKLPYQIDSLNPDFNCKEEG